MSRPCARRRIRGNPGSLYFKPSGIRMRDLKEIVLELDEFEAIRLVDSLDLSQSEAGEKMNVSQSTLSRILKSGRGKIARAVSEGFAIRIEK